LRQHRKIPYTGRNSSVCLSLDTEDMEAVWETARDFLRLEGAPGSDTGMCMGAWEAVTRDVIAFGHRAKTAVLTLEDAQQTASRTHLRLAGLSGSGAGVIGALAAVGLHREGNDGRFLWLPGLPGLQGRFIVSDILERARIDAFARSRMQSFLLMPWSRWVPVRPLCDGQATWWWSIRRAVIGPGQSPDRKLSD
jgi:hypothetical protein